MKMIHYKTFCGYWSNCENSEISSPQSKGNTDDITAYVYIQTEASNRTWLFVSYCMLMCLTIKSMWCNTNYIVCLYLS